MLNRFDIAKLFLLSAFCAVSASAQHLSVGVVGGAPFTDVVNSYNQNNLAFLPKSTNFTIGPSLQINLPLNLRFEFDVLYRPYSFSPMATAPLLTANYTVSATQWSFPFLLQYRFNTPVVKPFVEVGASFDHLADINSAVNNITTGPGTLLQRSNGSVILGGGVDVKIPFVRLSGELRYSHLGSPDFQAISNLNQAEVLLGVHF
jgi:Outer membrane protein beta-barrel domain